jgi:hypothetical protein
MILGATCGPGEILAPSHSGPPAPRTPTPAHEPQVVGDAVIEPEPELNAELATPPPPPPVCDCYFGDGDYCASGVAGESASRGCQVALAASHPSDLLHCSGGSWSVGQSCGGRGCIAAPPHQNDACAPDPADTAYYLPWACNQTETVTQGNHGDICGSYGGDHTGAQAYAWDFGLPRHSGLKATRGGTITLVANVTGPGGACYDGCPQAFGSSDFWACCNGCINTSNHVNIDHGDGAVSTYWHMDVVTVSLGQHVNRGDLIGYSGTSGCSSGPHLHFQTMGHCPSSYCASIPISFAEAGVPGCGARVTSRNCP